MKKYSPKKILLLFIGSCALLIGGIGVFIPILPTTPFVLCAAGCYSASSPRLYKKLAGTKFFGEYIKNYREKTGISTQTRLIGIAFLWAMMILSAVLIHKPVMYIVLAVIGTAVTVHIALIRRKTNSKQ
jgi:uncharacterized membrane protein YbaN (DUF454 family)